jgi:transcriptional regulator with XRE-family HTH domain
MDNVRSLRLVPSARPVTPEPLWREAVGQQLRQVRHRRGERIADVASRAGVSPQYLSELERGRKDPSSEMLSALAGALELPLRSLLQSATKELAPARESAPGTGPVCLAA